MKEDAMHVHATVTMSMSAHRSSANVLIRVRMLVIVDRRSLAIRLIARVSIFIRVAMVRSTMLIVCMIMRRSLPRPFDQAVQT
jgi:hypothetical protein